MSGQNQIKIIQFKAKETEHNPMKRLHILIHGNDNELLDFQFQDDLKFSWSMVVPQQSNQVVMNRNFERILTAF